MMRYLYFIGLNLLLAACSTQEREPQEAATRLPEAVAPPAATVVAEAETATTPVQKAVLLPKKQYARPAITTSTRSRPKREPLTAVPNSVQAAAYIQVSKPAQVFQLLPSRDTVLRAAEGTVLWVPANAFVDPTGCSIAAGLVELRVRELYSLADIVLNNLSTRSGNQLLETGGMVQLEASAAGQLCTLRKDARLLLSLPTTRRQPDMQLFTGVRTNAPNTLDWQTPRAQLNLEVEYWKIKRATFPKGAGPLTQQLRKTISYSPAVRRQLDAMKPAQAARRELRRLSRNLGRPVLAVVHTRFRISESGNVLQPETTGGVYLPELAEQVRTAISQLPRWNPARWEGVAVPSWHSISTRFTTDGKLLIDEYWDVMETYRQFEKSQFVLAFERQVSDSTLQQATASNISRYLFSIGQLGWINCDRFIESPQPRITFAINTGPADTDVKLVFKNMRSVLTGRSSRGQTEFANLPQGEPVTIVAIRQQNDTTYLATQATILGPRTEQNLTFRAVNLTQLKEAINRLETP